MTARTTPLDLPDPTGDPHPGAAPEPGGPTGPAPAAAPAYVPSGRRLGRRALVLGGSLSGLLTASVLARHFDQVVIVERDDVLDRPPGPRRGVPQGAHSHGLLVGGGRAMERLLPGLTDDLLAHGAIRTDVVDRVRWWLGRAEQARFDSDLKSLVASRSLIEDAVRRRVLRLPGMLLLGGHDIAGLVLSTDRRQVLGARVAPSHPAPPADSGTTPADGPVPDELLAAGLPLDGLRVDGEVRADLVVDASGRGSRAALWLTEFGFPAVREDVVQAGVSYVTRRFRDHPGVLAGLDGEVVASGPGGSRSGVALRQEDGDWSVTLAGEFGERPPSELAAFQEFARGLPTPGLAEITTECEPVGEPRRFSYPASRWLRWERVSDRPERFVVVGDAVCSFNPVYGQGMSSAALQAEALGEVLGRGLPAVSARASAAIARVVSTPWTLATGPDRRHPSQPTKPLPERVLDRYLDRLLLVAADDRTVALAFSRVLNLLAAPPSLLAPGVVLRVLRPRRRPVRG